MYSVQELSEIVSAVVGQKIEDGSFDEVIAGAVDDYLTKHPVDITALEGLDISVGSLDADGLVTGEEIIEKMSGYSFTLGDNANFTWEKIYAGAVKNGNKLTLVLAINVTKTAAYTSSTVTGSFTLPASVIAKLIPTTIGGYTALALSKVQCVDNTNTIVEVKHLVLKDADNNQVNFLLYGSDISNLVQNTKYYIRYELTLLLSDSL